MNYLAKFKDSSIEIIVNEYDNTCVIVILADGQLPMFVRTYTESAGIFKMVGSSKQIKQLFNLFGWVATWSPENGLYYLDLLKETR